MKKIIVLVFCFCLLLNCERRIKDYARHVSQSSIESQQFVYAPLGELAPGPVFSADSILIGIAPFAGSAMHDILVKPENFIGQKCTAFFSPGYFRLLNNEGDKFELTVSNDRFLIRVSSAKNRVHIHMPDSTVKINKNRIYSNLNGTSYHFTAQHSTKRDSLTYSTQESELLLYFTLADDNNLNWNFEHFYLNSLQSWNRALNSFTFKNNKLRGSFFTAVYQAMHPQAGGVQPNNAEFLLNQIDKNLHTQYVFKQLGLEWQNGEFKLVPPACNTAVIHFSQPVYVENQAEQTGHFYWNDQIITHLTKQQLISGGTLLYK